MFKINGRDSSRRRFLNAKRTTGALSAFAMCTGVLVATTATTGLITDGIVSAAPVCAATQTLTGGVADGYNTNNGEELSSRSALHQQFWQDGHPAGDRLPFKDFDDPVEDHWFAETFTGINVPAGHQICAATLGFAARVISSVPDNDSIGVHFIGPGAQRAAGGTWSADIRNYGTGGNYAGTLDLGSLPNAPSVLELMQDRKSLDVWIQDDTEVDFLILTISTKPLITIEKTTNGEDEAKVPLGGQVTWKYVITNHAEQPAVVDELIDDQEGQIDLEGCDPDNGVIQPGESIVCTQTGIASSEDYCNVATAVGVIEGFGEFEVSDRSCYTLIRPTEPKPCEDNLITNGDFENTIPGVTVNPDENIQVADGWGPIWQKPSGGSTGDLYAPGFLIPGADPVPASGNFGAFWAQSGPQSLLFREGIMNRLDGELNPNSGSTTLTFGTTQIFTGDAEFGVYGVLADSQAVAPAPTASTPLNTDLFGTGNVVPFGEITVFANNPSKNTRIGHSIPINTANLPGPVDRIFLTRTDDSVLVGRAFVTVDNFCLPQPNNEVFALPADAATFATVAPGRLFDTRTPESPSGYLSPGSILEVDVAGKLDVPAEASAVILNVTGTESDGPGFVTIWDCGDERPRVSNVNLTDMDQTVPNLAIAPISEDGTVCFYTKGGVHLLADVAGFFLPLGDTAIPAGPAALTTRQALTSPGVSAGRFVPNEPARLYDSRPTQPGPGPKGLIADGETVKVDVLGSSVAATLPTGVSAVVVNVTATETAAAGFITAYPSGTTRPTASSLNYASAGDTTANLAVIPLGADGSIELFSRGGAQLIVDLVGVFTDDTAEASGSGIFVPLTPSRVFDTREAPAPFGALAADETIDVVFGGVAGVPADAGAVFATVTGTETAGPGFVKVWATGDDVPATSTVNFTGAGVTRPNAAIFDLGDGGAVSFYSKSGNHLLVDVSGYFTA